jgi:hypothetical protein
VLFQNAARNQDYSLDDTWPVGKVLDRVNTGDGVEAGVRKWQRPGCIYRPKFGALGQAALGCK